MARKSVGSFVKWAGSKASLAPRILELLPDKIDLYAEPFLGGGSVFFALADVGRFSDESTIRLSDANKWLINAWLQVRNNVEEVATLLDLWRDDKATFMALRDKWQATVSDEGTMCALDAARFLYLNRATFNGLWRVNKAGGLNMPYGAIPAGGRDLTQRPKLFAACNVLNDCDVKILACTYDDAINAFLCELDQHRHETTAVCYLDPPYLPASKTARFDTYTAEGFGMDDQIALEKVARQLVHAGVIVVASGADTEATRHVWRSSGWEMHEVKARRKISRDGDGRGPVGELLFHGALR